MGKINWTRVLLGGLLAGVIINAVEFLINGVVLARDWEAVMKALGRPPMAPSALVVFVIWGFLAVSAPSGFTQRLVRASAWERGRQP